MDNYKRELAFILFRRWPVIVITASSVMMLAIFVVLFWPRTFGAEGSLLIKGSRLEKAPEALEDTQLRPAPVSEEDLISQVAILTSRELMRRTVDDLRASGMSALLDTLGDTDRARARKLEGSIVARVVPTSNVIRVTFTHSDRAAATVLLSSVLKNFITYQQEVFSPETVSSFLSDQMRRFQSDLRVKNTEMANLIESTGLTSVELQIEQNLVLKRELQSQLNQAETSALNQNALIKRIDDEMNSADISLFTFVENLGIQALSDKLQLALVNRADLARRYRPEGATSVERYDVMINDLHDQLRREIEGIRDETDARYQVTLQRIEDLRNRIRAIDEENVLLRTNYLKLKEMEREAEIIQTSYETFFRRNEEAIIQTSGGSGFVTSYVSLVQPPTALDAPVFPRTLPILAAGMFAAMFLGLTLGFFAELQDSTLKRPEEIRRRLGIPILFSISDIDDEPFPIISRKLLLLRSGLVILLLLVLGVVWRFVASGEDMENDLFQVDPMLELSQSRNEPVTPLPSVDLDGNEQRRPNRDGPANPAGESAASSEQLGRADTNASRPSESKQPSQVIVPTTDPMTTAVPRPNVSGDIDVVNPARVPYYLLAGSVIVELTGTNDFALEVKSSTRWNDLEPYLAAMEEAGFEARIADMRGSGSGPFSLLVEVFSSVDEAYIIREEMLGSMEPDG